MKSFFIILIGVVLIFSSCGIAYRTFFGIDTTPNWLLTEKDYKKAEKKIGIQGNFMFEMDTVAYHDTVRALKNQLLQNHEELNPNDSLGLKLIHAVSSVDLQPVQLRLFDKSGNEIFKIANCYLDVLPIDWNIQNCFSSFPPKVEDIVLNTHHFDIHLILHSLTEKIDFNALPKSNYYAVIMWNKFMIRPSKKLIEQIEESFGLQHPEVTYLYVNNHNATIWNLAEAEQREYLHKKIKEYEELQKEKNVETKGSNH